ncbi:hypothetical protein HMPREF1991_03142 [Hoylesella loescheii DSM 19665 = JCM 12249 = ATCC 15930]|uniref:Uncharacterized protein n=1 Tax=Hoylesella loescheii DSM 19665 = JCM 12249 = ATCC 15930 TaxID=1122985 RepID=A0A069QFL0_HOYLO|nr:hypothetical protein HMPREF1991_03142 [Hoylesella loescheii DSM 19665 = JCM 12249 = ATCC 15930]
MVHWRVWNKTPRPLNKTGQVNEWLSCQPVLRNRRHNNCVLSRTRVMNITSNI